MINLAVRPHSIPVSPRRRRMFRLIALALGIFAGLLGSELVIRITLALTIRGSLADLSPKIPTNPHKEVTLAQLMRTDTNPRIAYRFKEGARGTYLGKPVAIDSLGLRDDEVENPKPPATIRILGLGDSTMWGWMVNREETYIELVEDELNWMLAGKAPAFAKASAGWRVEAINTGVPGYMAVQEEATLELLAPKVEPDAVVIQYDLNDAEVPSFMLTEGVVLAPNFIFGRHIYLSWLPTLLRGRKATEDILKLLGREMDPKSRYAALQGWPALADSYRKAAEICKRRQIPCWVVLPAMEVFPGVPDKKYDEKYDPIRKLCGEIKMPVIDTFPITQKWAVEHHRTPADLAVAPGDWHPTPERHGLMARAILAGIAPRIVGKQLGPELARKRIAESGNICLRQMSGRGFYHPERHAGRRGNWTEQKAAMLVEPHGRAMRLPIHIGHPDASPRHPLIVNYTWNGKRIERRYTAPGDVMESFDCAGLDGKQVEFAIEMDRAFTAKGDPRALGILIYSAEFDDQTPSL